MVPLQSYPHVADDCTLLEALKIFSERHITMHGQTSLPRILLVFDRDNVLKGLVRRRDILRGLSPQWFFKPEAKHPEAVFDVEVDSNISDVLADKVVSRFGDRASMPITDYIQSISGTIEADDSLIRIVVIMVEKGYHMLPVMEDGTVIGVVRSVEVMWAVHEVLQGNSGPFDG